MVYWDMLPKAGASMEHPHLHPIVATRGYHGDLQRWHSNAHDYQGPRIIRQKSLDCINCQKLGAYFETLAKIHAELGLLVSVDDAWVLPSIVSNK